MHENSLNQAKVWLRGYLDEKVRMESLLRVRKELSATVRKFSGPPDASGNMAIEKTEAGEELDTIIRHIHETLLAREAMIAQLEDSRQRLILTLRYLEGLRWDAIAKTMCYEGSQVFNIHRQALREIQKLMAADGSGQHETSVQR